MIADLAAVGARAVRRHHRWVVALACVAAHPASVLAGQEVHMEWVASDDGRQVILNAYVLRSGIPSDVAGLLIERDPGATSSRMYSETGPFYASKQSAAFRRSLALAGDSLLVGFAATARGSAASRAAAGVVGSTGVPPLAAAEWSVLLDSLLQASRTVGDRGRTLVVGEVSAPARAAVAAEIRALFRQHPLNPVLPHLGGVVLLKGSSRQSTLDFQRVPVGRSATQTVDLSNVGLSPATVTVRLDPPTDSVFRVTASTVSLRPGETKELAVAAHPDSTGWHKAELALVGSGGTISGEDHGGEAQLR